MAAINPHFMYMNFFQIQRELERYKRLFKIFGERCFTAKEFKTTVDSIDYHHIYLRSLETYRSQNIITVDSFETFKVYGTKTSWGDFDICHEINDEIYAALPSQIQDLIIVQERKRNYYHVNLEGFNECCKIYETLKPLFKD